MAILIPKVGDVVLLPSGSEWLVQRYFPESTLVLLVKGDSDEKTNVFAEVLQPALTRRAAPEDVNTPLPD